VTGWSRRRFLALGGTAVAMVLAGCADDDDGGASTTTAPTPSTTTAPTSTTAAATTTTMPVTTTTTTATSTTTTTTSPAGALPVMDDATRATLDQLFDAQFAATGVAGLAGVVRIGDGVWTRSSGAADLASGEVFRPGDFMRIASITKTYTATAVLQLVDAGRVSLDDPLEMYVPSVINGTVATIRDLLAMQSGIPDFTANQAFGERFTADPTMPWTEADLLATIAEAPGPDFAPGERVAYCDSNYALLGMVMQAVTGEPAGTTITSAVIEPLGLKSTLYPTSAAIPAPHPTGYVPDLLDPTQPFDNTARPPRVVNDVNPAVASTAGAIISTLDDLQTWGTELVTGTLLRPETQAQRLQFRRFEGVPIDVGYGLGVLNVKDFIGHDGAIFGFSSVVLTRPQTQTQLAFVANESTNSTTPTMTVALEVIRALYPDQLT
jgi:D-alanyl-D-alanine carboxypeptidase